MEAGETRRRLNHPGLSRWLWKMMIQRERPMVYTTSPKRDSWMSAWRERGSGWGNVEGEGRYGEGEWGRRGAGRRRRIEGGERGERGEGGGNCAQDFVLTGRQWVRAARVHVFGMQCWYEE